MPRRQLGEWWWWVGEYEKTEGVDAKIPGQQTWQNGGLYADPLL